MVTKHDDFPITFLFAFTTACTSRDKLGVTVHRCLQSRSPRCGTWWTAAHLHCQLPSYVPSSQRLPCGRCYQLIFLRHCRSKIGHFLLSSRGPGTLCRTISMTQRVAIKSLEQHRKHSFHEVSEHLRSAIVLYKCTVTHTYVLGK